MTWDAVHTVRLPSGVSLAYRTSAPSSADAPTRAPLLLLHAWAESSRSFGRLLPLLPAGAPVLAPDLPGHGASDKPRAGYALAQVSDDVVALLDALDVPSALLVGSSSGGYVAQQVAVDHPDRVDGLVLVGAPRSLHGRPPFADDVDALRDPVDPAWVRASLDWFPRHVHVPEEYIEDRVRDGTAMPAAVWAATLAGLSEARPPTETGVIRAPALIIRGSRDQLVLRQEHDALAAAIPGSRLVAYADTGHLVLWERPERIAADIARFLADLS
ncbi:alpha/beta fold hydrolase [Planctomonas deserti]|uniref:alpha/beta fold hydrolase n=1 Tax=Planctomonas deserti TaxID=2144185 RepID=UPI000D3A2E07|nr:alpha/beta hydrolase [Planctomonas deserti]